MNDVILHHYRLTVQLRVKRSCTNIITRKSKKYTSSSCKLLIVTMLKRKHKVDERNDGFARGQPSGTLMSITFSHSIIICFNPSASRKNERAQFNDLCSNYQPCNSLGFVPRARIFRIIVQSRQNATRRTLSRGVVHPRWNTTSHCDRRNESDQVEPHNGRPVYICVCVCARAHVCVCVYEPSTTGSLVILLKLRESLDVREMTNQRRRQTERQPTRSLVIL